MEMSGNVTEPNTPLESKSVVDPELEPDPVGSKILYKDPDQTSSNFNDSDNMKYTESRFLSILL